MKALNSSTDSGRTSRTDLGGTAIAAGTGAGGKGAVGGGAAPFVFGISTVVDAISSSLDVAASSLDMIAVSSSRWTAGTTLSSMIATIKIWILEWNLGQKEGVQYRLMRVVKLCILFVAIFSCGKPFVPDAADRYVGMRK